jgi:hypothetical protein
MSVGKAHYADVDTHEKSPDSVWRRAGRTGGRWAQLFLDAGDDNTLHKEALGKEKEEDTRQQGHH